MNPAITPNGALPSDVPLTVFAGDGPVYGHRNPHPQNQYELHVHIDGAPGPFAIAKAKINMQTVSPACALYHAFPGSAWAPRATVPLIMEKISDTTYRTIFATDSLINEAYWHGKPACEWEFVAVGVFFKATGADGETGFNHFIDAKDLDSGKPVTSHFWRGYYPALTDLGSLDSFSTHGNSDIQQIKSEYRNNLFRIRKAHAAYGVAGVIFIYKA